MSATPDIQVLADKCRAMDRDYYAIIALQQTSEHVQPVVVHLMFAYQHNLEEFQREVKALDVEQYIALVSMITSNSQSSQVVL